MRSLRLALVLAASVAAGCLPGEIPSATPPVASIGPTGAPPTPASVELDVLGAASLKAALDKVKVEYEAANPGLTLTLALDASSTLETQIEQGAPADLFLSADTRNPQRLIDGGFATEPLVIFAGNKLTIIVPKDNPAGIESPADLADAGVEIIAAGDAVPITTYANQLVDNLAKEAGYPAGFAAAYAANVVSMEENVKAIVGKIELREGDAGIVYVTDAAASSNVATVEVPADANVPATYGGVFVKASKHEPDARAFLAWLAGPTGQAILAEFGFLPPS
jgi:molybdate transport system substrate-binding protein